MGIVWLPSLFLILGCTAIFCLFGTIRFLERNPLIFWVFPVILMYAVFILLLILIFASSLAETTEKFIQNELRTSQHRIHQKEGNKIKFRQTKSLRPFGVHVTPIKYIVYNYVLIYISIILDNTISLLLAV